MPDDQEVVYVDEMGRILDEEEVRERLKAIHDEEYADWGGWVDDDEMEFFDA